ncbi:GntR family transcriptional regulator [Streptomyces sp. BV286]|nr:GntR family transcriptional regulator [Streptomyces sp. BV286]
MPSLLAELVTPGVVRPTAVARIRDVVRERLARGQYRPGMLLPREIDFAREFGVSAQLVRDALRPLKADGTLYAVVSQGTYVADPKAPGPAGQGSRRARLEQTVRQRLNDGTYPPLTWLPLWSELAAEFGTSRTTVHSALAPLKDDGLLATVNGGTYVLDPEKPAALPAKRPRRSATGTQQTN